MPKPYVGMGDVKAAERRTPYTLAERRQIDEAIGKAIRPQAAGKDNGYWQESSQGGMGPDQW